MPNVKHMSDNLRQILGVRFYIGDLKGLLDRTMSGGLIVVPSAPVLVELQDNPAQREALERSDLAITDSGFMVLLWLLLKRERLPRISGLRYLRALLDRPEFRQSGATFWIMPSAADATANREWLNRQGLEVGPDDCYMAPIYPPGRLEDPVLLALIEARRPAFVVINLGGGVQERLGYRLRTRLDYHPAIICTGAAIAFLSGRQANIPSWADRLFLGWLVRSLRDPVKFVPRYRKAFCLAYLLRKYGAGTTAEKK